MPSQLASRTFRGEETAAALAPRAARGPRLVSPIPPGEAHRRKGSGCALGILPLCPLPGPEPPGMGRPCFCGGCRQRGPLCSFRTRLGLRPKGTMALERPGHWGGAARQGLGVTFSCGLQRLRQTKRLLDERKKVLGGVS